MQKKIDDMQKYTYEFLKDKTISSDLFYQISLLPLFIFLCSLSKVTYSILDKMT